MVHWDNLNVDNLCVCVYRMLTIKLLSYKPADGKLRKGHFFPWRACQHTKERKEQQWVKQWALVFQHSTCPIIYTPLTGAILKSVIGSKLFVSKCLAHSESTSAWSGWLMTYGLIVWRWLINYRLTGETLRKPSSDNPPPSHPGMWKLLLTNLQEAD